MDPKTKVFAGTRSKELWFYLASFW